MKKKIKKIKLSWRLFKKALKFSFLILASYEFRKSLTNTLHETKKFISEKNPEINKIVIREFFVIYGNITNITPKEVMKTTKKK